jgi:hypothetical protein
LIKKHQPVSGKKNFVLRIDEETFKALEKWAADEFRSVNGQLEYIIDRALKESGRKKPEKKTDTGSKDKQ